MQYIHKQLNKRTSCTILGTKSQPRRSVSKTMWNFLRKRGGIGWTSMNSAAPLMDGNLSLVIKQSGSRGSDQANRVVMTEEDKNGHRSLFHPPPQD